MVVRCAADGSAGAVPAAARFDVDTLPPGAFIRGDPADSGTVASTAFDASAAVLLGDGESLRVHFVAQRDLLAAGRGGGLHFTLSFIELNDNMYPRGGLALVPPLFSCFI